MAAVTVARALVCGRLDELDESRRLSIAEEMRDIERELERGPGILRTMKLIERREALKKKASP